MELYGQPLQSAVLLQIALSCCFGGLVDLRFSGPYHHLALAMFWPVPFLYVTHDFSLLHIGLIKNTENKKPEHLRACKLPDAPAWSQNNIINFLKTPTKNGALFENSPGIQKSTIKSVFTAVQMGQPGFGSRINLFDIYGIIQIRVNILPMKTE